MSTDTPPQKIEQVQKQSSWLSAAKTFSLIVAVAIFIFSLVIVVMSFVLPSDGDLDGGVFFRLFAAFILVVGEPIPLILYFYLSKKEKKQEVNYTPTQPANSRPLP